MSETVLIVDDDAEMRTILAACAKDLGLTVEEAENGVSGLARARLAPPDLILLDVEMPIMSGRETLTWLKDDHRLSPIPVIVVSGARETALAVRCIEAGAEDCLAKPVDFTLLRARIRASLERARLRRMEKAYQKQMETYEVQLEERVRQKARELADAHGRLRILDRAKSDFLGLISHELRTPMSGVLGACDALQDAETGAEREEAFALLRESVARLDRIVADALLLTEVKVSADTFALVPRALAPVVATASQRAAGAFADHGATFEYAVDAAGPVLCEESLLVQALASLLECAAKFSAPGRVVRLEATRAAEAVEIRIRAAGTGIPPALRPRFFEILALGAETLTPGGDLGLGPPVAAQILRVLGGSVAIESAEDGVCFLVQLRFA